MDKTRVLFLCTHNSARSQMAEAILRRLGGERFEVFSAGLEPGQVHPLTRQVLTESNHDLSAARSKGLDEFIGKQEFDYLITVCGNADDRCPFFPGQGKRLHWPFDDPSAVEGSQEERLAAFRKTRDAIEARMQNWLANSPDSVS